MDGIKKAKLKAYKREYYLNNKERIDAANKKWQLENRDSELARLKKWKRDNKEREAASQKKWQLENKEHTAAYQKKHYLKNKELVKAKVKKWQLDNKGRYAASLANYRAKKFRATVYMSPEMKRKVAEVYQIAQEASITTGYDWDVDHIVPLSKGGLHTLNNLQVVPAGWNRSKGNTNCDRYWD